MNDVMQGDKETSEDVEVRHGNIEKGQSLPRPESEGPKYAKCLKESWKKEKKGERGNEKRNSKSKRGEGRHRESQLERRSKEGRGPKA